jgi:hypothetical protein
VIFWVVTPRGLTGGYHINGGKYRYVLQDNVEGVSVVVSLQREVMMGNEANNIMEHSVSRSVKYVPFIAERRMSDGLGS